MAGISSLGIGSGIDVNSLLARLMEAERAPAEARLNAKEANLQAQLSAMGSVKGAMSEFQTSLAALKNLSTFQGRSVTSSDTSLLTASAAQTAGTGSYNIEVSQLAQSHALYTGAFASTSEVIGEGTLTFRFGTTVYNQGTKTYTSFTPNGATSTHTITIDATNNTLAGIRDAVNKANIGVQASIINDGSGNRLVFNSRNTGANNSMELVVSDNDGNHTDLSNLSRLAFNASAANLDQSRAALDANLSVNGLPVTSSTNTGITSIIEGLTLNLAGAQAGKTIKVDVKQDTGTVKTRVEGFVKAYNTLVDTIASVTKYDAQNKQSSPLTGDAGIRGLVNQIRQVLNTPLTGMDGLKSLADIGITTQLDGKLSLDGAKLQKAIDSNFDNIGYLFAAGGKPTDAGIGYIKATDKTQPGTYAVNITQMASKGAYTGAAAASLTVDATNDTFSVMVNGVQSGTITLTQKTYATNAEFAAELQSRINGDSALSAAGVAVSASFSGASYVITSNRYGSVSDVTVTSEDANSAATLGIGSAVGSHLAGVDVAGTIGSSAATGSGRELTGAGSADGLALEVKEGGVGDRGSVRFYRGVAERLGSLFDKMLASSGLIDGRNKGLNDRIKDIGEQREKLELRLEAVEKRYRAQFSAMDALVASMNSMGQYLSQQIASLPLAQSDK